MAETENIGEIANQITNDIFKWFKWEKHPLLNENFPCHKNELHQVSTRECLTHPVDVIFSYFDPYLGKTVILNTDLKSYTRNSISKTAIRKAIKSLSNTVDCAQSSPEWKEKYTDASKNYDFRGMLFVYNHDATYDKMFFSHFDGIKLENLVSKKNQIIHILEPKRIKYLYDVVTDMQKLYADDTFPKNDYSFYYPDLHLHRTNGNSANHPATIELLTSPYMIISHGDFMDGDTKIYDKGYIIYYNRDGSTEYEFMYLFDTLSRFQMLGKRVRIRIANDNPHTNIRTFYRNAINSYLMAWGSDQHKKAQLESIELNLISTVSPNYRAEELGWRI